MIEPMPDKAVEGGTDFQSLSDKMNEVIVAVNRLEELAKLSLGAPVGEPPKRYSVQSENSLTWPKDEKKGGLRMGPGITRRPKEKGE